MIVEYHRPENLEKALELLARPQPETFPLGGGTVLSRRRGQENIAVVDLQRLGLNRIEQEGQMLRIGAAVTLQQINDFEGFPPALRESLRSALSIEAQINLRRTATIAGTLVACDGRSPLVTAMLALDPRLVWLPGNEVQSLGDYLPLREMDGHKRLMTEVRLLLNATLRIETVARTPLDRPVVCAAVASWPSGRTRVALGGYGKAPILAMDGPEPGGAVLAAREAFRFAGDEWASAAYRMEVAGILVQRILAGRRTPDDGQPLP